MKPIQRFVICTDSAGEWESAAPARDRDRITELMQAKGWNVWHWFEDLWLVTNPGQEYSVGSIRDEIRALPSMGDKHVLVMEVEGVAYSGFGPNKAWAWMRKRWSGESV